MSSRRKIAFVKLGSFSHINAAVEAQLTRCFPEHGLSTLDLASGFFRPRPTALLNRARVWMQYGSELSSGRRDYWDCLYHTPAVFRAAKRWIDKRLRPLVGELSFTFQTQSLFDAHQAGVPHFIYTDHTHLATLGYPGMDRSRLFPDSWLALERQVYAKAAWRFTMSKHVERSLIADYGCNPARVKCVFAGSNAAVRTVSLDSDRFARKHILFNGTEWERKGGPEVVKALEILLRTHPETKLTILGCSPNLTGSQFDIRGRIPLADVSQHYQAASVFCLPTRNEPFGIAVVEAMHHGLPIVATDIGAMPDMVTDGVNGRLVPAGNVEMLATALSQLLGAPGECARMGEASLRRAQAYYTWDAAGDKMAATIGSANLK